MHELGIVFNIIDSVEEVGKENDIESVSSVILQVGEVSTVIDHYLQDCWKWAIKKSDLLQDADLIVEKIDAVTICEDCEKTYGTVEHGITCPLCGGRNTYLYAGDEVVIKEIEVDE